MEEQSRLAEVLNSELGLTPYESRAYVSLLIYGPMSPTELAEKASIPRPRAYDVLRSLMERGLLMGQSGKPSIYAVVDPALGLKNLLTNIEIETLRQLEEKRKTTQNLTQVLSDTYEKSRTLTLERSRVWYTQRNTAFIATYVEAIKNCERDFVVASRSLTAPEEEILEAVEIALKKGVSVRVVRQITDAWSLEDFRRYEKVLEAGSQVRYLDVKQIPLRFMVFDQKDVILVFPAESQGTRPQIIEALWLRIQPLAEILHEHFEELWRKGKPVAPILEEMKKRKQKGRKTV